MRADIKVNDVRPWGEKSVFVQWQCTEESQAEPPKHSCAPIGLFTIAYGRIMLYQVLDKLMDGVNDLDDVKSIYSDTDSAYILLKTGVTLESLGLPLGNGLGQLTNVLEENGPNSYITEFVALGPKAYSYIIFNPDTGVTTEVNKCKGTVTNDATLNFANMRNCVLNNNPFKPLKMTFTNSSKIKRKKFFNIVTEPRNKKNFIHLHKANRSPQQCYRTLRLYKRNSKCRCNR